MLSPRSVTRSSLKVLTKTSPVQSVAYTLAPMINGFWLSCLISPQSWSRDAAKTAVMNYLSRMFPDHYPQRYMTYATQQKCLLASWLYVFLGTGCSSNDGGTEDENVVNVYNWSDYIGPDTISKFEAEFGIKVNYDVYDSAEIVDVKLLTGNSGYDVVIHSNSFSARIAPAGVHEKLDMSRIPNIKHLDPATMRDHRCLP